MIEDLLEGILQGVFPLDTAHLGVVLQETGEIRGMEGAILRHLVETLTIETEEIQKIVGEIILLEDIHPNVDLLTDEGNLLLEGGTLQIEGDIHQIDEGIRHPEDILQIEREILHPGDTLLIEGGIHLLEGILQKKEDIHLTEGILQIEEEIHQIEEGTLQIDEQIL